MITSRMQKQDASSNNPKYQLTKPGGTSNKKETNTTFANNIRKLFRDITTIQQTPGEQPEIRNGSKEQDNNLTIITENNSERLREKERDLSSQSAA